MENLKPIEIKAFVPAQDFELSKQFYRDIGFVMQSEGSGVAYFNFMQCAFLLQDFCTEELANNFMIHLLVEDVDAWHAHILSANIQEKYGSRISAVMLQPWRMRDFTFNDPSGVLWRIGQNSEFLDPSRRLAR